MSEKEKTIKALELFNEKAEELLSSTFAKKMLEGETGVTLNWNYETGEEITNFERKGPDKENIKAFVLDFRFFIQNNDKTSFGNLKKLYSSSLLNAKFESRFDSVRDALKNYLDTHSEIEIDYYGEILVRGKIIDTFIYGGLSHANKDKEILFREWKSMPELFPFLENEFVFSLAQILGVIAFVKT